MSALATEAEAAWVRHLARAVQLVDDGTIPRPRAPDYKCAWLSGYRGDPFPAEGADDGLIDRAFMAGTRAREYATGVRTDESADAATANHQH